MVLKTYRVRMRKPSGAWFVVISSGCNECDAEINARRDNPGCTVAGRAEEI